MTIKTATTSTLPYAFCPSHTHTHCRWKEETGMRSSFVIRNDCSYERVLYPVFRQCDCSTFAYRTVSVRNILTFTIVPVPEHPSITESTICTYGVRSIYIYHMFYVYNLYIDTDATVFIVIEYPGQYRRNFSYRE